MMSGGKATGTIRVDHKGQSHQLAFTFNAQCELCDLLQTDIMSFLLRLEAVEESKRLDPRDFRAIIWASMLRDNPKATLADAGEIAEGRGLTGTVDLAMSLIRESGLVDGSDGDDSGNAPAGQATKPRKA